ncbi:Asp/Glu racemase [Microbacterium sp. NPDC057650]|uniref:maleate cis-trans isomerase family protein n=1 Tax=unclassified Microbacterium TaxID=2609290 RepID=UPI003670F478
MSRRIGMIVPSSNTCLEPQTYRMLGDRTDVTVHFARIEVTRIALDGDADAQFDEQIMVDAAKLLATAKVDAIAWNGTSGSWLGLEHDEAITDAITAATGIPATTSSLALVDALARNGVTQLGLVTPYTPDVNLGVAAEYARHGLEVTVERHLGLEDNESFGRVLPEELAPLVQQTFDAGVQGTAVLCTNLYGAPIVESLEAGAEARVYDSVAVTLWKCLDMIGAAGLDARWGKALAG